MRMIPSDRTRLYALVALYAVLALVWVGFARWVVPPLLIVERPGPLLAAVQHYIQSPPALFLTRDILGRWREFSGAVLIAGLLHLTILGILRRYDLQAAEGRSLAEVRAGRRGSRALGIVALAFLAVTVLSGPRQDYYFYLQMWYEIRQGHDPWFIVPGIHGVGPLNAYGPLFNLLAGLPWINPLAPKLLFATAYVLFSIAQIKGFTAGRPASGLKALGLAALFWNPFPWVEIAVQGHFDVLVGLSCLAAVRAWGRGHDIRAGMWLAAGVLLKYLPIVLLPFLAFDRGRLRPRFLVLATVSIVLGLALSCSVWGLSTLSPLTFAANRASTTLSIFAFIHGRYSPLHWFQGPWNYDYLAPYVLFLALLSAWFWHRVGQPDAEASAVVAVVILVLLYRVGFPQYQMVPFVLASSWALRHWEHLRGRTALIVAMTCYFGWLAVFDGYYCFVENFGQVLRWHLVQDAVGLPTFLFGCAFLAGVVRSATPADWDVVHPPRGAAGDGAGPGVGAHPPV